MATSETSETEPKVAWVKLIRKAIFVSHVLAKTEISKAGAKIVCNNVLKSRYLANKCRRWVPGRY